MYKVNMLTDTGVNVTINLVEDVELEPLTQAAANVRCY